MEEVYLSRRNLLVLLSKLDRKAMGEETACAIIKSDNTHPTYPQTMQQIKVVAIEDGEYYTDRGAGKIHPADEVGVDPRRDTKVIAKLREETAAPLMECKKALYVSDGDFDKAKEYLMSPNWHVGKIMCKSSFSYDERGWEPN